MCFIKFLGFEFLNVEEVEWVDNSSYISLGHLWGGGGWGGIENLHFEATAKKVLRFLQFYFASLRPKIT